MLPMFSMVARLFFRVVLIHVFSMRTAMLVVLALNDNARHVVGICIIGVLGSESKSPV